MKPRGESDYYRVNHESGNLYYGDTINYDALAQILQTTNAKIDIFAKVGGITKRITAKNILVLKKRLEI